MGKDVYIQHCDSSKRKVWKMCFIFCDSRLGKCTYISLFKLRKCKYGIQGNARLGKVYLRSCNAGNMNLHFYD